MKIVLVFQSSIGFCKSYIHKMKTYFDDIVDILLSFILEQDDFILDFKHRCLKQKV